MTRTTLAAVLLAALLAAPAAGACAEPYQPMAFDLWSYKPRPHVVIYAGQCVIDPGFWIYTPPPSERPPLGRAVAV